MRRKNCPQCDRPSLLFLGVDTFGCLVCDQWTEEPHACHFKYGSCDSGFEDAPQYPSQYKGRIEDARDK